MLKDLRQKLDQINCELVSLVKERTVIVRKIAELKKEFKLPVFQPSREKQLKEHVHSLAEKEGVDPHLINELMELLIEHSKMEQKKI